MFDKRSGPGDEYEEWEYPDPKDVDDLSRLPLDDGSSRKGTGLSLLPKIVGGLILLTFIGSLLAPLLNARSSGVDSPGAGATGHEAEDAQSYEQWIGDNVNLALREWGALGQVQFLGVQFNNSASDPIIGLLAGNDPATYPGNTALQGYSVAILGRVFADSRANSVTLAWLRPAVDGGSGEVQEEVALVVGVLRSTARGIDWANLRAEDLSGSVDLYQESPTENEGSL